MIKTVRTENIYNVLSTITDLTDICKVYNGKPHKKATPSGSYMYILKPSEVTNTPSMSGYLWKTARMQFVIVCKDTFTDTENAERVLYDIVDVINNAIVQQDCLPISDWDGFTMIHVNEWPISPIFYDEQNRPLINKDYLFDYWVND